MIRTTCGAARRNASRTAHPLTLASVLASPSARTALPCLARQTPMRGAVALPRPCPLCARRWRHLCGNDVRLHLRPHAQAARRVGRLQDEEDTVRMRMRRCACGCGCGLAGWPAGWLTGVPHEDEAMRSAGVRAAGPAGRPAGLQAAWRGGGGGERAACSGRLTANSGSTTHLWRSRRAL